MKKFYVSVRKVFDETYLVEAESEDAVYNLGDAAFCDDTLYEDWGGDTKIVSVAPYEEDKAHE